MIQLKNLSNKELGEISKQISDSFYDYKYNEDDMGLIKYLSNRDNMFIYMNAIVKAAYKSGLLYATSTNCEGYLILSGFGFGSVKILDGFKMIFAEKKALGGFKNMKSFIKSCFSEGGSIETRTKKAKRKYIKIEMLVVRQEFQKQGFMRKLLNDVYSIADNNKVLVILDTDDKDKCKRYEYLGMTLDKTRCCSERFHLYDLIREPNVN